MSPKSPFPAVEIIFGYSKYFVDPNRKMSLRSFSDMGHWCCILARTWYDKYYIDYILCILQCTTIPLGLTFLLSATTTALPMTFWAPGIVLSSIGAAMAVATFLFRTKGDKWTSSDIGFVFIGSILVLFCFIFVGIIADNRLWSPLLPKTIELIDTVSIIWFVISIYLIIGGLFHFGTNAIVLNVSIIFTNASYAIYYNVPTFHHLLCSLWTCCLILTTTSLIYKCVRESIVGKKPIIELYSNDPTWLAVGTTLMFWQFAALGISIWTFIDWTIDSDFPFTSMQRNVFYLAQLLPSAIGILIGIGMTVYYLGKCLIACPRCFRSCCGAWRDDLQNDIEKARIEADLEILTDKKGYQQIK